MQLTEDQLIAAYEDGFNSFCSQINIDPVRLIEKQAEGAYYTICKCSKCGATQDTNPGESCSKSNCKGMMMEKQAAPWEVLTGNGWTAYDGGPKLLTAGKGIKLPEILSKLGKLSNGKKLIGYLLAAVGGGVGLNYLANKGKTPVDNRRNTSALLGGLFGLGGVAGGYAYNKYRGDKEIDPITKQEKSKSPLLPMLAGGIGGVAIGAGMPYLKAAEDIKKEAAWPLLIPLLSALGGVSIGGGIGLDAYVKSKQLAGMEDYRTRLKNSLSKGTGLGAGAGALAGAGIGALMPDEEVIDPVTGERTTKKNRARRAMIASLIGTGVGGAIGAGAGALGTSLQKKSAIEIPNEIKDSLMNSLKKYAPAGAGIGALAGGTIGGLIPNEDEVDPTTGEPKSNRLNRILKGLLIGGGVGALGGAGYGALNTSLIKEPSKPVVNDASLNKPYSELSPIGATAKAYQESGAYDYLTRKPEWGKGMGLQDVENMVNPEVAILRAWKKLLTTPMDKQLKDLKEQMMNPPGVGYLNPMNYIRATNRGLGSLMGNIATPRISREEAIKLIQRNRGIKQGEIEFKKPVKKIKPDRDGDFPISAQTVGVSDVPKTNVVPLGTLGNKGN